MSLKELTPEKHRIAENTPFMKAVLSKSLPYELWVDWTYQKTLFYGAIEEAANHHGLLDDLPDIRRTAYITQDYISMNKDNANHVFRPVVVDYYHYLQNIKDSSNKLMAHLYTWHMGDMFGGQAIKKIVPGSHRSLEFEDIRTLMNNFRTKLNDDMGEEANLAFDWAIRMMRDYDAYLGQD
jgi:heme oxygenase